MTKSVCKKNVALVFGITEEYGFALANTLIGLKKHNKKFWDEYECEKKIVHKARRFGI